MLCQFFSVNHCQAQPLKGPPLAKWHTKPTGLSGFWKLTCRWIHTKDIQRLQEHVFLHVFFPGSCLHAKSRASRERMWMMWDPVVPFTLQVSTSALMRRTKSLATRSQVSRWGSGQRKTFSPRRDLPICPVENVETQPAMLTHWINTLQSPESWQIERSKVWTGITCLSLEFGIVEGSCLNTHWPHHVWGNWGFWSKRVLDHPWIESLWGQRYHPETRSFVEWWPAIGLK